MEEPDGGKVFVDGDYILWDKDKMTFINVEEDFYGRDQITFEYNGKEYKSLVVMQSYSPFDDIEESESVA